MTPRLSIAALGLVFAGCGLVDESYATTGAKSINGIDAFVALLKEVGSVESVAHVSERVLRKADVLVHFETSPSPDQHYVASVEAWLQKLPLPAPPKVARKPKKQQPETGQHGADDPDDPADSDDPDDPDGPAETEDPKTGGDPSDPKAPAADKSKHHFLAPDRPRTLLYVAYDTNASIDFWDRLVQQMKGHSVEQSWCEHQRMIRQRGEQLVGPGTALFGTRTLKSRTARRVPVAGELAIDQLKWPLRQAPGPLRSHTGAVLPSRPLLSDRGGVPLVRLARAPAARLLFVYNAAPLLNYNLVRRAERLFARRLVAVAAAGQPAERPHFVLVTGNLLPAATAARADNPLKILTTFPISLILIHLLGLLVLFLLARWPHEETPLDVAPRGTRAFLEHIDALGERLSRTRGRIMAVRGIKRLLERQTRFRSPAETPDPTAATGSESAARYNNAQILAEAVQYWENPKE